MNLMAVSLAAVIVVLIAVKIKELDSGYGIVLSIAGCVMLMYFVVSRFRLIASYIDRLTAYVSVNISYIDVILKMIGIAYICRFHQISAKMPAAMPWHPRWRWRER